jgi:threonine/homoserine/homoserine lactone efflux protein
MEFVWLFAKGGVIGLVIAAPVGPIGLLCISRTLERGPIVGLATGLGAAAADAAYGAVAAFGLMQIATALSEHQVALRLFGGLALCGLGLRSLLSRPAAMGAEGGDPSDPADPDWTKRHLTQCFGSAFLLTLANPATIFSFLAIFAALGWAEGLRGGAAASILVAGVFLGSALWWLGLSSATGLLRTRMDLRHRAWIQRGSGIAIFSFGLFAFLSAVV